MAATRTTEAAAVTKKTFDAEINRFDAAVNENGDERHNNSNNNIYVVVVPKRFKGLLGVVDFGKGLGKFMKSRCVSHTMF